MEVGVDLEFNFRHERLAADDARQGQTGAGTPVVGDVFRELLFGAQDLATDGAGGSDRHLAVGKFVFRQGGNIGEDFVANVAFVLPV